MLRLSALRALGRLRVMILLEPLPENSTSALGFAASEVDAEEDRGDDMLRGLHNRGTCKRECNDEESNESARVMPRGRVPRKPLFKVVVRRLPGALTFEELQEQMSPMPDSEYVWFEPSKIDFLPYDFSRCYFVFNSEKDCIEFSRRINNKEFTDSRGQKTAARVEMAPYQNVPRSTPESTKNDPKCGTIEDNYSYKSFLDKLNSASQTAHLTLDEQIKLLKEKTAKEKEGILVTPLTKYMVHQADAKAAKAQERRARFLAKEEQKKAKIQASRAADRERGGGNDSRSQRNEQKNKRAETRTERRERQRKEFKDSKKPFNKKEVEKKEEKETKDNEEATKSLKEALGVSSKTENTSAASTKEPVTFTRTTRTFTNRGMKAEGRAAAGNKAGTSNASEGDKRNDEDGKKKVRNIHQFIYYIITIS
ncbi:hypothetical protein WR25_06715 isoform E [Diploscapter pachys]|uniref:UPF3 domain-containing protein n=1 Tax=Diploscapter pachys TaxID=2018661 RepID=A0A2A2M116_9BILA|nr:hypothetical protein WR25_06715 isoform E [Diploscapter pachys]